MSETAQQWWYERSGQQAGPVPLSKLQELAASGELKPATKVWTAGMTDWARAETVPSLAWPPAPPPLAPEPPPLATTPAPPPLATTPWTPGRPSTAAAAVAEPEEIGVAVVILLSIVTLGVFGLVKFFQTARAYERLAGRETRFALYFWLFVGLLASGFLFGGGGLLAAPLGIAAIVFQFLALGEALRARREGMQRWSLQAQTTSDSTHYLFFALGLALSVVVVGLLFLVLQAVRWFQDWNAIRAAALRATSRAPTPS